MTSNGPSLAARILEVAALADEATTNAALEWAEVSLSPDARAPFVRLLNAARAAHDSARTDLAPPVAAEPELRTTPPPDVDAGRAQEVGAILADPEFIDRRGLLTLLRELFGDDVVGESDARRGRQELVARGVRRFAGLPADQKTRIYTTLRRRFLRDRRSTLEGWSNTIRGGK